MRYSDDDLLRMVGNERKRSIGFGEGDSGELTAARERALEYARGEMRDVPSLPNRSKAVDTTVADAIETVLPDVMEVFVGGEDVATFVPAGQDDEERAQEETDFVQHVIFTENEGFLTLYTAIKDALLTRTGIIHWWWEENEHEDTITGLNSDQASIKLLEQPGSELEDGEDGTLSLKTTKLHGKVCIKAFPSEDFTVAPDTVSLKDATYCAVRDRPRVQELIARGIDAAKARDLPGYVHRNDAIEERRDHAGETQSTTDGASDDLRTVEVRAHYLRLAPEDGGQLEVWRIITDSEERVLLDKDKVGHIPFAAGTPYIVPHRFYGESVADKLIEVQKIKTALLRMLLDSGYYALNQRNYVDMTQANEFTIQDLLRMEPGVPVRGQGPNGVTPLSTGALNFDVFSAMEFVSTMAESRSGIVRNAQGLNPDTLHDTAKGAMALIAVAQKRVRMIARILAETLVKDLFVGVHCMLREGYTDDHETASAKLGSQWKQIKPQAWRERCAMTVHVGVGSAGREHELMIGTQRLELMERLMQAPGAMGTLIDAKNIHQGLTAWERAAGSKTPDLYWSDPKDAPPQPPQPDPEMEKVKGMLALDRQKAEADVSLTREKAQVDAETTAQKHQMDAEAAERQAQRDHELKVADIAANMELKRYQVDQELQLKREQLTAELELKRELGYAQAQVAHETGMAKVNASTSQVKPGGEAG